MPKVSEFSNMTISWTAAPYDSVIGGPIVYGTGGFYYTEVASFIETAELSLVKGFGFASEGLENYYKAVENLVIPKEAQEEINHNLLKPLHEYLRFASIGDIKSKVKIITEEAESLLIKEGLFIEVINRILTKIKEMLRSLHGEYEIYMFVGKNRESESAQEEIVISVGIKNISFAESISIWEKIENVVESIFKQIKESLIKVEKYEDVTLLSKIDEKLCIGVKRL